MEGGRLSFRIVDVHLTDQASTLFTRKPFLLAGKDDEEEGVPAGGGEVLEESVLQMSKLGLPTSFSSAPRRSCSHRSRRHRSRDQVTPSLVCDVVNASVEQPPLPSDSMQVSMEGSVEDDPVRGSNDQANHSADADTLEALPISMDDGTKDGEASASSCQVTSCPVQIYELAGNFINKMEALLLNREPTSCEKANMPEIVMAVSAEVMAANDDNVSFDQAERLRKDGSTISNAGASSVDEGFVPSKGANIPEVDVVAVVDSASNEGSGVRIDNLSVEVAEQEIHAEDSHLSDIGCSNSETQQSTWEPPIGFETYGSVTYLQGSDKDHVTNGVLTDFVADEKEVSIQDDPKMQDLQHEASCTEFVSRNDDGTAERVAKGGGVLTVSNSVAQLVEDAFSSGIFVEHGEIELSDHLVEAGGIADSASCPQIAMKIDTVQVKVMEPSVEETCSKDSESASLENRHWSVWWDEYYTRYYFYNAETSESTWEPPKGFEAYAKNDSSNSSNGASKSEAFFSKENKAEITLEDSSTLLQALEIVSSSTDSKTQDSSSRKESEKEVVLEFDCLEVSSEIIEHVEVANCKATVLRKRAKKAAQYFLQLANQHVSAAASSPTTSKYWFQRFHLFSKYDSGIKLDEEGWFSVTPEAIAKHQAARCKGSVIIDAFIGVGGNAIQFALAGHHVIGIDNDPKRIEYAHHNAKVYGVADRIDFVLGDFFTVSSSMQADVVFLSPPWGGPDYLDAAVYDILTMLQPKDGATLLNAAHSVAPNIILFLPRNVDMNQLAQLLETLSFPCSCEVERNFLNGKLKAITAYYGQFASTVELSTANEHLL